MEEFQTDVMRILVVDDEKAVLDSYQEILGIQKKHFGSELKLEKLAATLFGEPPEEPQRVRFDLAQCRQGEKAVETVKKAIDEERPFAVAFIDVRLPPGPDGVWAAEHIRAVDPNLEIVIVTAYSDVDPSEIAGRVPPSDKLLYVQKPFHPQEIRHFASALSAKWKAERLLRNTNVELEQRVRDRTVALKKANEQLKKEIAQRKKAHGELQQVFKAAVPLCVIDTDFNMLRVNDTFCSLFSMNRDKILGKKCFQIWQGPFCGTRKCPMKNILRGEKSSKHEEEKRLTDGRTVSCAVTAVPYKGVDGELIGIVENFTDITERKRSEEALRKREAELELKSRHLEEANTALKVLLRQGDDHKAEIELRVLSNLKELVLPNIEILRQGDLDLKLRHQLDVLESNLKELISPFSQKLASEYLGLTSKEIQVANLVKAGKTTKEIAKLLGVSTNAIVFHRYHIRKKLGLKNRKVNLGSYLTSLS